MATRAACHEPHVLFAILVSMLAFAACVVPGAMCSDNRFVQWCFGELLGYFVLFSIFVFGKHSQSRYCSFVVSSLDRYAIALRLRPRAP